MRREEIIVGRDYRCRIKHRVVRVRVQTAPTTDDERLWLVTVVETGLDEFVHRPEQFRGPWVERMAEPMAETGAYPPPLDRIDGERMARVIKAGVPSEQVLDSPECNNYHNLDRCSTPRCRGETAVNHLGKPLCSACWQRVCETNETPADGSAGASESTIVATNTKENPMSKSSKNAKKSGTKSFKKAAATKTDKPTTAKAKAASKPKVQRPPAADAKPKRLSALDAAAQVLKAAGKAMNCVELIATMAEQNLWTSPNGKTPHATLYAAILREVNTKGDEARFKKVDRGQFEYVGA
ncbi:hypothetical protein RAS1_14110 [Phycisphaerae bacterium RAS1]|nr:hypothetical protein RAS1_14110 [Phycisphaerae bacterium RAS1]